jgi:LmbE family N-acetylglucosaminyl deacetylase
MERIQAILEKKGETLPYPVEVLGTEDARVAIWLDVGPVLEMKLRAIRCHKSQLGPKSLVNRIPEEFLRDALGTECYSVARGIPMFHLFPSGPPKEDP